jgi:glycosyltransferase involved in cell wall biosynthesis
MITVLIATYNGARTLPEVLSAYLRLVTPEGGWKLVAIDNGSTDQTKEIIFSFADRLPLTYLFEPTPGRNVALNSALSTISGDLVVFSDDDALPCTSWLTCYRSAADLHPDFFIFSGPILPKWQNPPAKWILEWVPMGPAFALLNREEDGPAPARLAFGPNWAVRSNIFDQGYRFDEAMGPKRLSYPMGGETELTRRLEKSGFKTWFCRDAVVSHIIRSYQMRRDWILSRAVRYGRGQYRLAKKTSLPASRSHLPIPPRLLKEIAAQSVRLGRAWLATDEERLFKARWQMNYVLGQAIEAKNCWSDEIAKEPFLMNRVCHRPRSAE